MFMLYHMTLYALYDVFVKQWTDWSTLPDLEFASEPVSFYCNNAWLAM